MPITLIHNIVKDDANTDYEVWIIHVNNIDSSVYFQIDCAADMTHADFKNIFDATIYNSEYSKYFPVDATNDNEVDFSICIEKTGEISICKNGSELIFKNKKDFTDLINQMYARFLIIKSK